MREDSGKARPGRLAIAVATVVGNAVLVVSTLALGAVAAVVGWIPPRGDWMFRLARLWSRLLLAGGGMRLDVAREVELAPDVSYVFMANHQSLLDIPVLIASLPGQTRFLAKASLFRIPIFGWALHAGGFVPVDRRNEQAARGSLTVARRRLSEGRSLLVFPEATRSRDGELLPFRRGGFLLALKVGRPIVPVGIDGTLEAKPRGSVLNVPRTIRVRYGAPIDPARHGLTGRAALVAEVRGEVERLRSGREEPRRDDGPEVS